MSGMIRLPRSLASPKKMPLTVPSLKCLLSLTCRLQYRFRTKSNEIRHLLVNATTRRDAENNVVGVVGVAQDVTEAVQRDRAVAGMALELRQLIDTANAVSFDVLVREDRASRFLLELTLHLLSLIACYSLYLG
jgi:hypothetical protein